MPNRKIIFKKLSKSQKNRRLRQFLINSKYNILCETSAFLQLKKLCSEIKSLKTLVSKVLLMLSDKNDVSDSADLHSEFRLPIQSKTQLSVFESKLKNNIAATQYKNIVKQIGGTNFEKHIRNALVITISDVMAYRMSWTGAKDTIMAKHMIHMALIKDVISQKWITADDTNIEHVIKSWLQHAGDRLKLNKNSNKVQ